MSRFKACTLFASLVAVAAFNYGCGSPSHPSTNPAVTTASPNANMASAQGLALALTGNYAGNFNRRLDDGTTATFPFQVYLTVNVTGPGTNAGMGAFPAPGASPVPGVAYYPAPNYAPNPYVGNGYGGFGMGYGAGLPAPGISPYPGMGAFPQMRPYQAAYAHLNFQAMGPDSTGAQQDFSFDVDADPYHSAYPWFGDQVYGFVSHGTVTGLAANPVLFELYIAFANGNRFDPAQSKIIIKDCGLSQAAECNFSNTASDSITSRDAWFSGLVKL